MLERTPKGPAQLRSLCDKEINMKTTKEIWREYHNKLPAFIRQRVENDISADLLQDVFLKIHTRLDSLKEDINLES